MTPAAPSASAPALSTLAFFEGFPESFLSLLSAHAHLRLFEPGGEVVHEGAPADAFFIVLAGKVALEVVLPDRPRRTIQTVGPGEVLGWSWLVPPHRWRLDARAVKSTRLLAIEAEALRRTLSERPVEGYRFLLRLLPVIAQRLENTRLQVLDLHAA